MSRSEVDVQDLRMMERCLELARQGVKQGELPFGAVIASRGQVIAEATNHVSSECDVTRHAELVALSEAQKSFKTKAFAGLHLVFNRRTLPVMRSFPAREARIGRVVFAISSPIMGGFSRWNVLSDNSLSSKLPEVFGPAPEIVSGLLSQRAEQVWRDWNPLAWRFMRLTRPLRTSGQADFVPRGRASANVFLERAGGYFRPRRLFSVSNVFLRRRADSNTISDLDEP